MRKYSPSKPSKPFTLAHFKAWAARLTLDNGKPWIIEDFQAKFVQDLFLGQPANWLIVPEGNAKTTLTAGVALYHAEFKDSAFVPVGASSREQAETLFKQAKGFVDRSPRLQKIFESLPGYRKIRGLEPNSSLIQVYAADEKTGDGVIPTLAIIDEPHRQKDMGLYRTWRGKLTKRHGQLVAISTSGEPGSEFETARDKIRQSVEVIERTETFLRGRSPSLVFHEWAIPEKGDVEDLELVKRANPLKAMTLEELQAKRESPDWNLAHWRRMVCNLPTREENSAITEAEWYAARIPNLAPGLSAIPEGQAIWLGLDIGWKWDTTGIVPFWKRDHHHRLFGPAEVIVPPRNGDSTHPQTIKDAILRIHRRNRIETVVMDMTDAEEIAHWLEDELRVRVVDRTQNNPNAIQDYSRFMEALRNGWLRHSGDAALKAHALNAVTRLLPSGVRFDRMSSSRAAIKQDQRVIDALTAAAMVHSVAMAVPEAEPVFAAAWR